MTTLYGDGVSSRVGCLPAPTSLSAELLRRQVEYRADRGDVRAAFPVVLARAWRLRLAELTGVTQMVPGKPLIAGAVGAELWLYSCSADLEIGHLVAVCPEHLVSPIDGPIAPSFVVDQRRLQVGVEWFDQARIALGLIRRRRPQP